MDEGRAVIYGLLLADCGRCGRTTKGEAGKVRIVKRAVIIGGRDDSNRPILK